MFNIIPLKIFIYNYIDMLWIMDKYLTNIIHFNTMTLIGHRNSNSGNDCNKIISRNEKWNWKRRKNHSKTRENDYMIVISTKRFVLQWLCNDLLNVFIFRWANCKRHMSKPLTNSLCFIKDCWKSLTFVGINSRQILKQKIVTFFVINSLHLYLSKYKEIRL